MVSTITVADVTQVMWEDTAIKIRMSVLRRLVYTVWTLTYICVSVSVFFFKTALLLLLLSLLLLPLLLQLLMLGIQNVSNRFYYVLRKNVHGFNSNFAL